MSTLKIERVGGFAGFGGTNSHLQSKGEIEMDDLSHEDKKVVEDLFGPQDKGEENPATDAFRYKISRMTPGGMESIEAGEDQVPTAIKQSVKDEIV